MMESLLVGAVFIAAGAWMVTVLVGRWAIREQRAERERLERIMKANEPPAAPGWPHKRVG